MNSHLLPFFFFLKKQLKKLDVPSKKTVTIYENCRFIIRGFPSISVWNLTFALFLSKNNNENTMYSAAKLLRFVKVVVFLLVIFLQILSESSPLPLFCQKTKKTRCTFQKNRYVLWKLLFYYYGLFQNVGLKYHVLFFFGIKTSKNMVYLS